MRFVAVTIAAAALILGACETDSGNDSAGYGYGYGYGGGCHQFGSCGTCTPVEGCGWCFDSDGTGMCAASPDECATPVFSWTWNPAGCRVPADAGAVQVTDAGLLLSTTPGADAALTSDGGAGETDSESDAAVADADSVPGEASIPDREPPPQVEVR
jgi:hypothetical protein